MKSREFEVPKKTTYESSTSIHKRGPKVENTFTGSKTELMQDLDGESLNSAVLDNS